MSLQRKPKHETSPLIDKNKILKLEKCETLVSLAKECGVGRAATHDMRQNNDKERLSLKK